MITSLLSRTAAKRLLEDEAEAAITRQRNDCVTEEELRSLRRVAARDRGLGIGYLTNTEIDTILT